MRGDGEGDQRAAHPATSQSSGESGWYDGAPSVVGAPSRESASSTSAATPVRHLGSDAANFGGMRCAGTRCNVVQEASTPVGRRCSYQHAAGNGECVCAEAVCGVGVGGHAHAHLIREVLIDTTSPAQPTVEPLDAPARVRLHAMRCCKLLFSRGTLLQVVVCSRRLSRSMLLRAPPPPPPPLPACPALAARRHATRHAAQSRRQGSAALTARAVARRSAGGWERVRLWPEGSQG